MIPIPIIKISLRAATSGVFLKIVRNGRTDWSMHRGQCLHNRVRSLSEEGGNESSPTCTPDPLDGNPQWRTHFPCEQSFGYPICRACAVASFISPELCFKIFDRALVALERPLAWLSQKHWAILTLVMVQPGSLLCLDWPTNESLCPWYKYSQASTLTFSRSTLIKKKRIGNTPPAVHCQSSPPFRVGVASLHEILSRLFADSFAAQIHQSSECSVSRTLSASLCILRNTYRDLMSPHPSLFSVRPFERFRLLVR